MGFGHMGFRVRALRGFRAWGKVLDCIHPKQLVAGFYLDQNDSFGSSRDTRAFRMHCVLEERRRKRHRDATETRERLSF